MAMTIGQSRPLSPALVQTQPSDRAPSVVLSSPSTDVYRVQQESLERTTTVMNPEVGMRFANVNIADRVTLMRRGVSQVSGFSLVRGFNLAHQVFTVHSPEVPYATPHSIFDVAPPRIPVTLDRTLSQPLLNRGEISLLHEITNADSGVVGEADQVEPVHVLIFQRNDLGFLGVFRPTCQPVGNRVLHPVLTVSYVPRTVRLKQTSLPVGRPAWDQMCGTACSGL